MYRYFERNGKKFLVFFGVFLMVAFIVPTGFRSCALSTNGRAAGKLAGQTVYEGQLSSAKSEWELLTTRLPHGREFAYMEMGLALAGFPQQQFGAQSMPGLEGQIDKHPDLFFLLSHEAEQQGIVVSDDTINTIVANDFPEAKQVGVNPLAVQEAVRRVMLIGALRDRLASSVKVSEPAILHTNAPEWQSVRLNLVEFTTSEFEKTVPAPTTQQVQAQFDQYKNVLPVPGSRSAGNPLDFGYEVPDRVQVQYITVPRQQVLDTVRATKSAYDWDVDARMYYQEHQEEFIRPAPPETQPATREALGPPVPTTQLATQAATQPATLPAVASTQPAGPTTRPFAEVKKEILDKILAPEADKLSDTITAAIRTRLSDDYKTYAAEHPTTRSASPETQPTTGPASYDSLAYLESVAADIQKQYKLLPEVHQIAQWSDSSSLSKLQGIGMAHNADEQTFAEIATEAAAAEPTTAPAQPPPPKLQLFQPSDVLFDSAKNDYLFRVTAISPAHAPELNETLARVQEDAKVKAAYDMATTHARELLDQAKKSGLAAAAIADHKPIVSTGEFRLSRPFIPNFIAGQAATRTLMGKARALVEEATPENPHPVAMVELPSEKKVVVAELADVSLGASDSELFADKLQAWLGDTNRQVEMLSRDWFNYDAVVARLKWQPAKSESDSGS